jgi:Na+/alanine symporter
MTILVCIFSLLLVALLVSWVQDDLRQGEALFESFELTEAGFGRPTPLQAKVVALVIMAFVFSSWLQKALEEFALS